MISSRVNIAQGRSTLDMQQFILQFDKTPQPALEKVRKQIKVVGFKDASNFQEWAI